MNFVIGDVVLIEREGSFPMRGKIMRVFYSEARDLVYHVHTGSDAKGVPTACEVSNSELLIRDPITQECKTKMSKIEPKKAAPEIEAQDDSEDGEESVERPRRAGRPPKNG